MTISLSYVGYFDHRVICDGCDYVGYHGNVAEAVADYRRHIQHPGTLPSAAAEGDNQ